MTHTYAILYISRDAYNEIRSKLANAGYTCAMTDNEIDMHELALAPEPIVAKERLECICAQGVTKCPRHGEQPAERETCPLCNSVLGYCVEGQYCTRESCAYVY